jgi:hypothetical protein
LAKAKVIAFDRVPAVIVQPIGHRDAGATAGFIEDILVAINNERVIEEVVVSWRRAIIVHFAADHQRRNRHAVAPPQQVFAANRQHRPRAATAAAFHGADLATAVLTAFEMQAFLVAAVEIQRIDALGNDHRPTAFIEQRAFNNFALDDLARRQRLAGR